MVLVSKRGRFLVGELLFERGGQIELGGGRRAATPGRMALVELGQGRGRARVVRQLGDPRLAADVLDAMLEDRQIRVGFSRRIEEEAGEAAARAAALDVDRRDLRDLPTFTVDPASAHDFDDAVSASRTERGVRLWIHIADVAAHVRPRAPLEKEAYRRANSTYVPGRVAPMLPHALSSDACSLAPDRDRLAVTSEIELSESGEPLSASFYRSLIRSDVRLDYDELDEIFAGRSRAPGAIAEPLGLARQAASALAGRRPRSSLEVESFEPEFRFEDGRVTGAHSVPQTEAHRLIEHLMILTNERVAELLERRRVPTIYRVHEQPDPERIRRMIEQLAALDDPDAGAAGVDHPPAGGRARRGSEPAGRPGGRASRPRPRGVYIACASLAATGALRGSQPRPCRPGQSRLHALHLPDPPLPGPDRSPLPACRRSGRGRRRRAPRVSPRSPPTARSASATQPAPSATPTRSVPRSCSSTSSSSAVPTPGSRARSRAWSGPAPSFASAARSPTSTRVSFPLGGSAAASAMSSTRTETMLVGRSWRRSDSDRRPGHSQQSTGSEAPRGRVDLLPAES